MTAPTITTITSDAQCKNCTSATNSLYINWYGNPSNIMITGTGFTSATSSVTDLSTRNRPQGYGIGITSISDTKVQYGIGSNPSTGLPTTFAFTIIDSSMQSALMTVPVLPLIAGKVYGSIP